MVPSKFINKTGNHSILVNGSTITVKVADCVSAINHFIADSNGPGYDDVVGLEYKQTVDANGKASGTYGLMVLSSGYSGKCLVICLDKVPCYQTPESLKKYLTDKDRCFVKASSFSCNHHTVMDYLDNKAIGAGELAARVLNKPDLIGSSLTQVALQVGITGSCSHELGTTIQIEQNYPGVLTSEQVKKAVTNAYLCNRIGLKLLFSR